MLRLWSPLSCALRSCRRPPPRAPRPGEIDGIEALDALLVEELTVRENRRVKTALMMAAMFNHVQMVELLVARGADPKARDAAAATGLVAVADDSGLAVDVLGGCPGVFSARWAGTHGDDQANIDLLLAQTADVPVDKLIARFECSVVLAMPDGALHSATGTVEGRLTREQRGDNGFGYDPIFELPDGRTMAELTADEKAAISHRGRAFRAILPQVAALV